MSLISEDNKHTYKNIDCLEFLESIPDESVDLILTDPPYYIGYDGGKGWDTQWKSDSDYLSWCESWTKQCFRVLKPNRMMCVFGTLKYDNFLHYKLDVLNKIPDLYSQNEIVWSYNWGGRSKSNFARKHEYIWCYSKTPKFLFNEDEIRIGRKQKINIRTGKEFEKGTIPTCVWEKNNHTTSKEYCDWHPTQKPISILERFIQAYTNPVISRGADPEIENLQGCRAIHVSLVPPSPYSVLDSKFLQMPLFPSHNRFHFSNRLSIRVL
jgi:DNA modification methylase